MISFFLLCTLQIKRIVPSSAAGQCKQLEAGDRLVSVNGKPVQGLTTQAARELLKTTPDCVKLVVSRRAAATTSGLKQRRGSQRTRQLRPADSTGDIGSSTKLSDSQTTLSTLQDDEGVQPLSRYGSQESLDRVSMGSTVSERRGTMRRRSSITPGHNISMTMARRAGISMADVKALELVKGNSGLGFSIVGGAGSTSGQQQISIKTVFAGGPAAKSKQVDEGDILIEVNGKDFTSITRSEAVTVLKNIPQGPVRLLLCSAPKTS